MPRVPVSLRDPARSSRQRPTALLHYAASERDADMLYATGLLAPDAFLFLQCGRRRVVAVSDLELGRARAQAHLTEVLSWSAYARALARPSRPADPARIIAHILTERRLRRVCVPSSFPVGLAQALARQGLRLEVARVPFWRQREIKRPREVRAITATLRAAEAGIAAGIAALAACRVGHSGRLRRNGRDFTADDLRSVVNSTVLAHGAMPAHTICACGEQAIDPHESGHGPLLAHAPIVIDVFPRCDTTGYFADITRTVVRGHASERLRETYAVVSGALDLALACARPGVRGSTVHERVRAYFERHGFVTAEHHGRMQGFIHGTGHGVGLEIHEAPHISAGRAGRLRVGHVVAVEPGLYYRGLGGVRIEDLAQMTRRGCRSLVRLPRVLEI